MAATLPAQSNKIPEGFAEMSGMPGFYSTTDGSSVLRKVGEDFVQVDAGRVLALAARRGAAEASKATREAAESLAPSADEILRAEEEEVAKMERDEADARAWKEARAKYGKGRVAKIDTPDGALIMRVSSLSEMDDIGRRIQGIDDPAAKTEIMRSSHIDLIVYPSPADARKRLTEWPGLWAHAFNAQDALSRGEVERFEGKA